ncbi:hypothetical protein M378DRAFT_166831 [Amanita muscaria Koide BX008]|uniref:Uncharacterized protein n=1 Tax=Amanita muscaria (strain Koide BX008) TaxID=946122 RepID=A0A0C2WXK4_AMAMK|nr:hypothetical protein M378DRAFT_166831 [Amanita muscaria Koide BX008]
MAQASFHFSSSLLFFFACFFTPIRASEGKSRAYYDPSLLMATFAFSIIFAILALGQLTFLILFALRRRGGDISGIATEQAIHGYRVRFTILMVLNFVSLILEYSMRASTLHSQTLSITTVLAYVSMPEFSDALLYATIIVLLDSCTGSTEVSAHRSSNGKVNIAVSVSLLIVMTISTIARNVVIRELSIAESSGNLGSWGLRLAELILRHLHILIYLVLTIYFTVVAVSMWNQRHGRVTARFGLEGNLNLRVMKVISHWLILTAH